MHQKIEELPSTGFRTIELSFPDLPAFASRYFGRDIAADDYPSLTAAAASPLGSEKREDAFARARGWVGIISAAGTDMLQVGSSDSPEIRDTPVERLTGDLRQLADMLSEKVFRLAYENWCWAMRAPTWKAAWDLVRQVGRPNIGLYLDTFQSAGRVPDDDGGDAYRVDPPFSKDPDAATGLRPRGWWCHKYRPLPYDGGYLPVRNVVEAVLTTGFQGWFSMEVFDGRFQEKYGNDLKPA
ncbi:Xylose isomerase-like, TIM barrel domain protein [Niveomyces insectorum RCEF 264]|uniref:Xylose isomerase-like, TIM barrel domain protein n=1 Tax=Niveomyces insectorum RCEF 264 TaxID=1081102 RepID=A0A162L7T5_9HYPO|nr:Xylose isomerase-like, TIM barrel domain protein [Niveomyces insectorum RCEF 264]